LQWETQGCTFTSDVKVLHLQHYDMIIGMDWLEAFSPMKVDWKNKWLVLPYHGSHALLQGVVPAVPEGSIVEVTAVLVVDGKAVQLDVPPEMQMLLE